MRTQRLTAKTLGKSVAVAAIALSMPAMALAGGKMAGPVTDAQIYAPVAAAAPFVHQFDWTGGYAGLSLGLGKGTHTPELPATLPSSSGGVAGVIAGYNWQSGGAVFGIEGTYLAGRIDGTGECTDAAWTCDSRISSLASIRGRVGAALDNTLVFVSAGPAMGRVRHTTDDGTDSFPDTQNVKGFVVGLGAEHALAGGWNMRGDLEHYRFGKRDFDLDLPYTDTRTRATVGRVSVLFRF